MPTVRSRRRRRPGQTLTEYLPEDPEPIGSEGDAHADFTRSLTHRIRDHSVDPDACQSERDQTERGDEPCLDARLRTCGGDAFLHRLDFGDALIGVDLVNFRFDSGNQRTRIG